MQRCAYSTAGALIDLFLIFGHSQIEPPLCKKILKFQIQNLYETGPRSKYYWPISVSRAEGWRPNSSCFRLCDNNPR